MHLTLMLCWLEFLTEVTLKVHRWCLYQTHATDNDRTPKSKWKPQPATNMYSHCSVLTENPLFNFPVCVVSIILLFDTQSKCHRKKPQECHVVAFYFTFIRNNVYAAVFNLIKVLYNKFVIYISSNDRKWMKKINLTYTYDY